MQTNGKEKRVNMLCKITSLSVDGWWHVLTRAGRWYQFFSFKLNRMPHFKCSPNSVENWLTSIEAFEIWDQWLSDRTLPSYDYSVKYRKNFTSRISFCINLFFILHIFSFPTRFRKGHVQTWIEKLTQTIPENEREKDFYQLLRLNEWDYLTETF